MSSTGDSPHPRIVFLQFCEGFWRLVIYGKPWGVYGKPSIFPEEKRQSPHSLGAVFHHNPWWDNHPLPENNLHTHTHLIRLHIDIYIIILLLLFIILHNIYICNICIIYSTYNIPYHVLPPHLAIFQWWYRLPGCGRRLFGFPRSPPWRWFSRPHCDLIGMMLSKDNYPLVNIQKTMENHHF